METTMFLFLLSHCKASVLPFSPWHDAKMCVPLLFVGLFSLRDEFLLRDEGGKLFVKHLI